MKSNKQKGDGQMSSMIIRPLQMMVLSLTLLMVSQAMAESVTQVFNLQPGWNAIYLEIEPDEDDIEQIFASIPVLSVWRWMPPEPGTDFITDPSEGLLQREGWFAYFPPKRPEAFLSNLFKMDSHHAYLINVEGLDPVTLTISGVPDYQDLTWAPDAYTLTGLPVSEVNPPSFAEFFQYSPHHQNAEIYQLSNDGHWQIVTDPLLVSAEAGKAYWIYTKGRSTYQAPLQLDTEGFTTLDFDRFVTTVRLTYTNNSDSDVDVTLERLSGNSLPLNYEIRDEETNESSYPGLPDSITMTVGANASKLARYEVDRSRFVQDSYADVYQLESSNGVRYRFEVSGKAAEEIPDPEAPGFANKGTASSQLMGLWIGRVLVDGVSESQLAGTTPEAVGKPFSLSFIIHVDATGNAKLLKQVIRMWDPGTLVPSPTDPDLLEVGESGREVLLTDTSLIPNFEGLRLRDGQPVATRYSTVAYDFNENDKVMNGVFQPGGTLDVALVMQPEDPTNPFKHKYHPDHDNLDAQFTNYKAEAYEVTRSMQFQLSATNPSENGSSDYGSSEIAGNYFETLSGLHKNPIFVSGTFRLVRVAQIPALNQ
ncbi:MAG: hypothetical protein ACWA5R_14410 [bacterium]